MFFVVSFTWTPLLAVTLLTYSLLSASDGITSSIITAAYDVHLVISNGQHYCIGDTTWSLKLTGLLRWYRFLLISIATLGLNIFSSSNASSSSSSLKYCILDCILDALVDILDCILDVFVDILDPDIVVLPCSQGPTQLGAPPPLHYRPLGSKDLLSFSPLFKKLPHLKWSIVSLSWWSAPGIILLTKGMVVLNFLPPRQLMPWPWTRAESRQEKQAVL